MATAVLDSLLYCNQRPRVRHCFSAITEYSQKVWLFFFFWRSDEWRVSTREVVQLTFPHCSNASQFQKALHNLVSLRHKKWHNERYLTGVARLVEWRDTSDERDAPNPSNRNNKMNCSSGTGWAKTEQHQQVILFWKFPLKMMDACLGDQGKGASLEQSGLERVPKGMPHARLTRRKARHLLYRVCFWSTRRRRDHWSDELGWKVSCT
jgi:hypothetical protein